MSILCFFLDIADYRLVKGAARGFYGLALGNAAHGDDRDLGRAAADIHDHVSVGLFDVNAGADSRRNSGLDKIHSARTGLDRSIDHRALFNAGYAAGNAHEYPRLEQAERGYSADKLTQHERGHIVIGDNARSYRVDSDNVCRGAAKRFFRLLAYFEHFVLYLIDRNDRRLAQNKSLALRENKCVRCSHINCYISFVYDHKMLRSAAKMPRG